MKKYFISAVCMVAVAITSNFSSVISAQPTYSDKLKEQNRIREQTRKDDAALERQNDINRQKTVVLHTKEMMLY